MEKIGETAAAAATTTTTTKSKRIQRMIFKNLHINDPLCLNKIQEGDRFAGPQFESPTASMLNQLMWGNIEEGNFGVVFHLPYFGNLKAGNLPGSFYHASMRTSDPMFIRKHIQKMERNISVGLNVGLIIGSKTTLNSNAGESQEAVSCESCYPIDSDSDRFRDTSLTSPNGTSCSPFQREEPNGALCHDGACLTSIQRNCMCNYESVPGSQYADYLLRIPESIVQQFDDWYHKHSCWYPQTSRGVQEMVAASNSAFLNQKSFHGYVSPWTECSCSRNVMAREMSDAIVIILPPNKTSLCSLSIRDLQYIQRQLRILYRQKYSSLPITIMQQTKGIDKEECVYLWEGIKCNEGYRKVLFSQTYYFPDGTCIARKKQDAERFYIGNTAECTSLKQKQIADERDASSYQVQPSNRTENSQTQESRPMLAVEGHAIGKSQANVLFLSVMGLLNWFVLVYFRRQILRFVGVSAKGTEGKHKEAAAFKDKIRRRDGNSRDETTDRKVRNCGFRLKARECIWISLAALIDAKRKRYNKDGGCTPRRRIRVGFNAMKCVYIGLATSISLLIGLNISFHHRLSVMIPVDILWNKMHFVPATLQRSYQSERGLSIFVHLEGGLGNHLSKIAMGLIIQSMAKQHGIQKTSLHIISQTEDFSGWNYYSKEFGSEYRRACKLCFPNLRNLMFLEGNEESFQNYLVKHDSILGPDLASRVTIGRERCRSFNCTVPPIEKALETVQEVWTQGELNLESGQWNSTFKEGAVLGPYSFPLIRTDQSNPTWPLIGRFNDAFVDYFRVDEDCFKVKAHPDEVVFHYRDLKKWKTEDRPYYDEMDFDSIATNLLGHLKGGDKLAIVVNKRFIVKPLIQRMRNRNNVTVRVISNKDFLDDFFFLLSAQRELIGRGESTFFIWAALLSKKVEVARLYYVDNGSEIKHRYLPGDFPPVMDNLQLQERLRFELYKV